MGIHGNVIKKLHIRNYKASYDNIAQEGCIIGPGNILSLTANMYMKMKNGNITSKFVHWNGGRAFLENKMEKIEEIINEHQPILMAISEAT